MKTTHKGPQDFFSESYVHIVEDDAALRESLELTLRSIGCNVYAYNTPLEFLKFSKNTMEFHPSVFVFDMRMPGMTGLQLHLKLQQAGSNIPVIFVSGESSMEQAVNSLQSGAFQFLIKPVTRTHLIQTVKKGLTEDRIRHQTWERKQLIQKRMALLTPREKEVFELVIRGFGNTEVAGELGMSVPTAKQHKSQVMLKFESRTFAQLLDFIDLEPRQS
jgi:FixJ family two-component response regulator